MRRANLSSAQTYLEPAHGSCYAWQLSFSWRAPPPSLPRAPPLLQGSSSCSPHHSCRTYSSPCQDAVTSVVLLSTTISDLENNLPWYGARNGYSQLSPQRFERGGCSFSPISKAARSKTSAVFSRHYTCAASQRPKMMVMIKPSVTT